MSYQQIADRRRYMRHEVDTRLTDEQKRRKQQQEKLDATRKLRQSAEPKPNTDLVFEYTPSDNLYEIRDAAGITKIDNSTPWDKMDGLVFKSKHLDIDSELHGRRFRKKRSA